MKFVRDDYSKWIHKAAETLIEYMSIDGVSSRPSVDDSCGLDEMAKKCRLVISSESLASPEFAISCIRRHKSKRHGGSDVWQSDDYDAKLEIIARTIATGQAKLMYKTGRGRSSVMHVMAASDFTHLISMARAACPEELWASLVSLFILKTGFAPPKIDG